MYQPSKPLTKKGKGLLHEGYLKMRQSLAKADQEARNRPSGLPKDWRNRILK